MMSTQSFSVHPCSGTVGIKDTSKSTNLSKGIHIPGDQAVEISQFADDTTIITDDPESLK